MLTKEQITKELHPDFDQQVYQDPVTKGLFVLKRIEGDKVVIGGGSGYYQSAITGLLRYAVPKDYFAKFIPINKDSSLLEVDKDISFSNYKPLKVKGWDCVNNDYIYSAISTSDKFHYLDETDDLVKANIQENPMFDFDEDTLDDYPDDDPNYNEGE